MKQWELYTNKKHQHVLALQLSWQQFWFGYSLEFGNVLFVGFGPFTLCWILQPADYYE